MNRVLTRSVASFGAALAVNVTCVAMVAPLAVLALVGEGRDCGSSRRLYGCRVRVGFGPLARTMALGTRASPRDRERVDLAGVLIAPGIHRWPSARLPAAVRAEAPLPTRPLRT